MRSVRLLLVWLALLLVVMPFAVQAQTAPVLAGCPVFPADNIWNARVDELPVHPRSADYVNSIGPTGSLHPDFGTFYQGAPIGIPFVVVPADQPRVPVVFGPDGFPEESDAGPMPIPANAPVEGGAGATGDRHVLVLRSGECKLYELYRAFPQAGGAWQADSSAVFDLRAHTLRPAGWTSADAAGLPILPGLVRYDEVKSGEIRHALRFTVARTQRAYVWPARHFASSSTDVTRPPMGMRFRLKRSVDISRFPADVQVIFTAFKRYGLVLADNGSNWYVSGAHDTRWNDAMLVGAFRQLKGADFEAVDASSLRLDPNSGQVRQSTPVFTPTAWLRLPVVRSGP
jgi:hypothetical protein